MISVADASLDANDVSGVLLIDCWEPRADKASKINPWHLRVLSFCQTLSLQCVVNASYACMLDYDIYNNGDHSHYNTMRLYNGLESGFNDLSRGTGSDFDLSQHGNSVMQNILRYSSGMNKTSAIIKNVTKNYPSIFLLTAEDFVHHWTWHLKKQVTNWFVIGQTWQMCLHQRPLGLKSLQTVSQQTGCRFYTAPWAMLNDNLDAITAKEFEDDSLHWHPVGNDQYCLGWQ